MRGSIVVGIILSAAQPAHVSNTFHLVVPDAAEPRSHSVWPGGRTLLGWAALES